MTGNMIMCQCFVDLLTAYQDKVKLSIDALEVNELEFAKETIEQLIEDINRGIFIVG